MAASKMVRKKTPISAKKKKKGRLAGVRARPRACTAKRAERCVPGMAALQQSGPPLLHCAHRNLLWGPGIVKRTHQKLKLTCYINPALQPNQLLMEIYLFQL